MRWIELEIKTTSEASDAICEKLIILGADGVTVEDPNEIASIINAPGSLSYADEGYVESLGSFTTIKTYFAELADGIRLGIKEEEIKTSIPGFVRSKSCCPSFMKSLPMSAGIFR
jgi:ribosomal protein L11 methyltransferase